MKFFVPATETAEQERGVYESIKIFLGEELGAQFSERRVRMLNWWHEGTKHEAEVGKPFDGEVVVAILYEPARNLYHVCTPNRGVLRGMPNLAGGAHVTGSMDFDLE